MKRILGVLVAALVVIGLCQPQKNGWYNVVFIGVIAIFICLPLWKLSQVHGPSHSFVCVHELGLTWEQNNQTYSFPFKLIKRVELHSVELYERMTNSPIVLLLTITTPDPTRSANLVYDIRNEIFLHHFAEGEGRILIQILQQHLPDAYFNESSLAYMNDNIIP